MVSPQDVDRAHRGLIAMWQLWMQWFTWFFGTQVVLLWAKPEWLEGDSSRQFVATAWLIYNASGIIVALLVASYTWRQRKILRIGFPVREATVSALLNALALGGNCALWWRIASI